MKHPLLTAAPLTVAAVLGTLPAGNAYGQFAPRGGHTEIPDSSIEQPQHIGVRAHTNYKMFMPAAGEMAKALPLQASPQVGPPYSGYFFETPASLGCVYQLVSPIASGCNPNNVAANPTGGSHAIAIVDAYHYPTAAADLITLSTQFGLRQPSFQVVYANGQRPPVNANWNIEETLDIEWAHAMAPGAKIYLVEAASNSFADLLQAVSVANTLLKAAGGGEVSMSWGGSEFSSERFYDGYFAKGGVVYFAAAGDSAGTIWPSTSPNVVSAGGTTNSRDANGNLQAQLAWSSTGGGPSKYESRPSYQSVISQVVGSKRGTPDVAADADPNTGVWVYNGPYCGGWCIVGGTSAAAPVWAGIINAAGRFAKSSQAELSTMYSNLGKAADFTDIAQGSCGPHQGYLAGTGWDFCTGTGSAFGKLGK